MVRTNPAWCDGLYLIIGVSYIPYSLMRLSMAPQNMDIRITRSVARRMNLTASCKPTLLRSENSDLSNSNHVDPTVSGINATRSRTKRRIPERIDAHDSQSPLEQRAAGATDDDLRHDAADDQPAKRRTPYRPKPTAQAGRACDRSLPTPT